MVVDSIIWDTNHNIDLCLFISQMAPVPGGKSKPLLIRWLKNGANLLLLGLKVLNVYSHWIINDEFERTAPSLVFFLLLR